MQTSFPKPYTGSPPQPGVDGQPGEHTRYVVGVDLGQSVDSTAISVLEHHTVWRVLNSRDSNKLSRDDAYRCRHLERLPLGMSYVDQAAKVGSLMKTAPIRDNGKLVIDQTGVGRPVFDIFRDQGVHPEAVAITSGDQSTRTDGIWRVPKLQLVSRLQAMLHAGDLQIAKGLPEADALAAELQDFRVSYTQGTGYARFSAREGRHDDLVLSLAIAAWYAVEKSGTGLHVRKLKGF